MFSNRNFAFIQFLQLLSLKSFRFTITSGIATLTSCPFIPDDETSFNHFFFISASNHPNKLKGEQRTEVRSNHRSTQLKIQGVAQIFAKFLIGPSFLDKISSGVNYFGIYLYCIFSYNVWYVAELMLS